MKTFAYTIKDENGIHARPAGMLVKIAQKYSSDIQIHCGGKGADIKRIFSVMGLGVKKGSSITITISGDDEAPAAQALEEFIRANL